MNPVNNSGIFLISGKPAKEFNTSQLKKNFINATASSESVKQVLLGDWLVAYLILERNAKASVFSDHELEILFDGYLTDVIGATLSDDSLSNPAKVLAEIYRNKGQLCVLDLRGSYTCLIVDHGNNSAYLFNDRLASRPFYYQTIDQQSILVATRISTIASLYSGSQLLNKTAVGEYLVRGCFYHDHTLFQNIYQFPQAGLLSFDKSSHKLKKYWHFHFKSSEKTDEATLLDECDTLMRQATRRLLRVAKDPILSLSGGVDARIVLAYLVQEGAANIPVITYGSKIRPENDAGIARIVATEYALPFHHYTVHVDDFTSVARLAMESIDGRVDTLDAPSLITLWEQLGNEYDMLFQGDQCFGWKDSVENVDSALGSFSWYNLDKAVRFSNWIEPQYRKEIQKSINVTLARLVAEVNDDNANNIKDVLFFREALGNVQNAYAANKRCFIDSARPLLDEDVIEFITRLPVKYRINKQFIYRLLALHPRLQQLPFAQSIALPEVNDYLLQTPQIRQELYQQIYANLSNHLHPQLSGMIEISKVLLTLTALKDGKPLPPVKQGWIDYIPILWRLRPAPVNSYHPFIGIRRIFGLNLYLNSIR